MIGGNVIETAVIYSNGSQECERISMLLKNLGGEFHEYLIDVDFSERQFQMEFGADATFPQVAIGNRHIGSMKETLQFLKNQKLI
jgi:glutaredoxin